MAAKTKGPVMPHLDPARALRLLLAGSAACAAVALTACGGETSSDARFEEYAPGAAKPAAKMDPGEQQRADAVRVQQISVKPLWSAGPKERGRILAGLTSPQNGRWVAPGQEPGLASGEFLCKQLDGAHVCSGSEIVKAVDQGDFAGAPAVSIWVPRLADVTHRGKKFAQTRQGSCDTYTYKTADRYWGSDAEITAGGPVNLDLGPESPDYDERCGVDRNVCMAHVPSGMGCNAERSIACCY